MMKILGAMAVLVALAGPAAAEDIGDVLVRQLQEQGYSGIRVGHTWLGRLRVVAQLDGMQREIVVNPYTGEILRDYLTPPTHYASNEEKGRRSSGSAATVAGDAGQALGVAAGDVSMPDVVRSVELGGKTGSVGTESSE